MPNEKPYDTNADYVRGFAAGESPDFSIPIALSPGAKMPVRAKSGDAGYDLCCVDSFTLAPGARKVVGTGVRVAISPGYYGRIAPRSGLAVKHGVDVLAGVVDSGYRDALGVVLINFGSEPVAFAAGDRIAQLIIERCHAVDFIACDALPESERGTGGYGSTGR